MSTAAKRMKQAGRLAIVIPSIIACALFLCDAATPSARQAVLPQNREAVVYTMAASEPTKQTRRLLLLASIGAIFAKLFGPVRRFLRNPSKTKFWGVLLLAVGALAISARFAFGSQLASFADTVLMGGIAVTGLSLAMIWAAKKMQPKRTGRMTCPQAKVSGDCQQLLSQ